MTTDLIHWLLYGGAMGLIVIGIVGVVTLNNIFRIVLALVIAEAGANLLLVIAGYRFDAIAPILTGSSVNQLMVDPVPQAMVLTSIVIGVGIQALALALVLKVYQNYKTLDIREIHQRLSTDIDSNSGVISLLSSEQPAGERPLPEPSAQNETAQLNQGGDK
ncbi:MAG: Na+/H+ antiporter subunit C [Gammaproteobacteria bacterium]|jgi:multisubunit Na+/H+ antiporter MnhC subunit|nr:Na+/H+ antiporter subunit C [Gammaproteobacteria bacterium]MBT3722067.1 Na+/H+ antiporter subunit C [Gammaproteobacteria bacterium]MBT4195960.1 Na+/H+ antiporter subunit C [Gammaproteobacteria bacterium]MBT4451568.1 Na+/H+ antiporter subunit C [Gammaproteobacteria bacterium]MBT4860190.1 Na+/H+ antiporter subunit C [Gammaproteobacteria bacterium]